MHEDLQAELDEVVDHYKIGALSRIVQEMEEAQLNTVCTNYEETLLM